MSCALFLDFDGVICDSVNECFVSSWIAYYHLHRGEPPASVHLDHYRRFRAMRPFIRSGEDYLLIHELIARDITVANQGEFDRAVDQAGTERMERYRSLIYQVREESTAGDLSAWLALHTAYPGLLAPLKELGGNDWVWIVSTKKPAFIVKILAGWGVIWPERRIMLPVDISKPEVIQAVMESIGAKNGVFVDDQRDHLSCDGLNWLSCRLAVWGYVSAEWLDDETLDPIQLNEFVELLGAYASGSSS